VILPLVGFPKIKITAILAAHRASQSGHSEGAGILRYLASIRARSTQFLALSLAIHLAVCTFVILHLLHPVITPAAQSKVQPETKYYPVMLFAPGGTKAPWTPKPPGRKRHVDSPKPTSDLAVNAQPAPPAGAPISVQHDPVAGSGADTQSADPAFPVFAPHPPVKDRSLLPDSSQQVIVDVKLSAEGDVLEATLVKGLGNALDQIVLDTVKTWRFHPATVNGSPVATEAELVFPFDEKYPTAAS
jgi:protein TonB